MKVNTTKLIIFVLLMALSWATHMRRRRMKRLGLEKRKGVGRTPSFETLFSSTMDDHNFKIGEVLGKGTYGTVFAIIYRSYVVKAVKYQNGDRNFLFNEVTMTDKAEGLSFSVSLCHHEELSIFEKKGLLMFFPRAKRDLSKAVEGNKIEFKKRKNSVK